ncbi:uncharacterized protein LOC107133685 [Marmota marmota marmota]|uniref:uncharacterized protein LOC107133685 n=1 Tax=Marmota marmota marmota TaxID=9994 RepID=UPI0020920D7C|nr:uncharacterized protein LOC107133685 [Marmota marmota marmota]
MDANAHHQQKSDSEKHQKVCAACGSRTFEPSTKTINGHGQGKSEIRKITEEEGLKTEKGNVISLSSYKRGNIKLMLVKRVDKGKDDTPVFHMEPHLDRSSKAEQKSFHDIDDTAHRQQKSDSEQLREECAAGVSSKFDPSTKTINGHGEGKFETRKRTEEEGMKTDKGISQNTHASSKHMKPAIIIKDSLLYKSKQKQERRTLKSGSSHHIIKHEKSYCSQCLLQKNAKLKNDLYELEKKYTEVKRVTSELKKENVAWKQELQILRDQLNEITNEDNKEIKKKPETSVRKFDTELNITADEFNQNLNLD